MTAIPREDRINSSLIFIRREGAEEVLDSTKGSSNDAITVGGISQLWSDEVWPEGQTLS